MICTTFVELLLDDISANLLNDSIMREKRGNYPILEKFPRECLYVWIFSHVCQIEAGPTFLSIAVSFYDPGKNLL